MISNIFKTIADEIQNNVLTPTFLEHVKSVAKSISGEYGMFMGVGINVIKGLQGVGAVALENGFAKSLISIAGVVNGLMQLVSPGIDLDEVTQLRTNIFASIDSPKPTDTRERRIQILTNSCNFAIANQKSIRKKLDLAKETKIDDMARRIQQALASDDAEVQTHALQDGEKFMQQLKDRVNVKFGVEIAKLAVRTTGVALSAISFFTGPVLPILIGFGVVGVATLALYAFEKVMLPKDPFSPPRDVWYEQVASDCRQSIIKINDTVKEACDQTTSYLNNFIHTI